MTTFHTRADCAFNSFGAALPDAGDGELWALPIRHLDRAVRALCRSSAGSAPFASTSSALSGKEHLPGAIRERAVTLQRGMEFPERYCHLSKKDCPTLVGTGVRSKKLAGLKNVDVYALGFYVDAHAARRELGKEFGCLPPVSLEHNQALAERLKAADGVRKSVRIVITSGMVNQGRFSSGLRDSLEPRVQQSGDAAALDEFEGLFRGARFYRGMEMVFSNTPRGALALRIDGRDVGQVASPGFTRAFFDLYLGADPVSRDGKASIARGLAQTISRAGS